jgi:hypothetical protein
VRVERNPIYSIFDLLMYESHVVVKRKLSTAILEVSVSGNPRGCETGINMTNMRQYDLACTAH